MESNRSHRGMIGAAIGAAVGIVTAVATERNCSGSEGAPCQGAVLLTNTVLVAGGAALGMFIGLFWPAP